MSKKGKKNLWDAHPLIAAQWNYEKNGELTPDKVSPFSNKKVWWKMRYVDQATEKQFVFEWEAVISSRTARGAGNCPFLDGKAVWPGFNDLASCFPDIACQWHPEKNGTLRPDEVTAYSNKSVWWLMPYDDPKTGRHFDFEWKSVIKKRTTGNTGGCPYLAGKVIWPGYNDLASSYPAIAAQWHPVKNGELTPSMVTAHSNKPVWWLMPYDDPKTGRHFDFEWQASVNSRVNRNGCCPFLSGKAVWPGYNDLLSLYPSISSEWNYKRNGDLTPDTVMPFSNKKVWWSKSYDDPVTGRHFVFEWEAVISSRVYQTADCPYMAGKAVWPGYNDLATRYPDIAAQWDTDKNGGRTPDRVLFNSDRLAYWRMSYTEHVTGRTFVFEWSSRIVDRTLKGYGCPYLKGTNVWTGFNDLETCYPEIAAQWDYVHNNSVPKEIHKRSSRKYWWKCPVCAHSWLASPYSRVVEGAECPWEKEHFNKRKRYE